MIPGVSDPSVGEGTSAGAPASGHRARVRAYFDAHVEEWDRDRYRDSAYVGRGGFAASILRALERKGRVLDVGCGAGRQALDAVQAGHTVVAIDLSYGMVQAARDRLRAEAPHAPALMVVADATALPFRQGSFDAAIALGLIGFVPDREALLDQLTTALRPDGQLVCDVGLPEERVLLNRVNRWLDLLLGWLVALVPRWAVPRIPPGFYAAHFAKATPDQLRRWLGARGFAVGGEAGAGFGELRLKGRPLLPWRATMLLTGWLNALSRRLWPGLLARHAMIYLVAARRNGQPSHRPAAASAP
jgi:SAM-dependent methyltransferase